jgi:hypothetical protein
VHAAEGLDVLAAVQEAPPEVLVVLFEPLNQVIVTGGNDGLVKVGDLLAGSGLAYDARGGGGSGLLAQCLSATSCCYCFDVSLIGVCGMLLQHFAP